MPDISSIGSSRAAWRRPGTSDERRLMYQAPSSRTIVASSAPTIEFVKDSGPMTNSSSASIATWIRLSPSSSGIYLLIASRATFQIVTIAAPLPSTIPISVKIGLVFSQLSSSNPPPSPIATESPNLIPRSSPSAQFGGRVGGGPSGGLSSCVMAPALVRVSPPHARADEQPDSDGRDQRSDPQADEHIKRRGPQIPVDDEAGDRASHQWDHHDRGHLGQDLDEPQRRQLCHSVRLTAVGRREYSRASRLVPWEGGPKDVRATPPQDRCAPAAPPRRLASMKISASAQRHIDAPADRVYRMIADFREHHPKFLPPQFGDLEVETGGIGAGTVHRFSLTLAGRRTEYRVRVGELEPGRVLIESDPSRLMLTTFTVDRELDGTSRVTIHTRWFTNGVAGVVERMLAPRMLRRVYRAELSLLDRYARE